MNENAEASENENALFSKAFGFHKFYSKNFWEHFKYLPDWNDFCVSQLSDFQYSGFQKACLGTLEF